MKRNVLESVLSVVVSVAMVATLTPSVAYAQEAEQTPEVEAEVFEPAAEPEAEAVEPEPAAQAAEPAPQAYAADSWLSQADTSWLKGAGTYEISTAAQLAGIASRVNNGQTLSGYSFCLTNNINLNQLNASGQALLWETSPTYAFEGMINGQGFSITGMTATSGRAALFGKVNNAAFYNLEISGDLTAGVAAAFAGSAVNSTFQNCINTATVTGTSETGLVAGLVGYALRCSFFDCQNAGRVSGPARAAGGIVGEALGCEFEYCINEQGVQGAPRAGGIIGTMALPSGIATRTTLAQCANQAAVQGGQFAGGLVGLAVAQTTITQSYNRAAVESGSYSFNDAAYAGGFIGYVGASESTVVVEDGFNSGSVWAVASGSASHAFAGGVLGGTGSRFALARLYTTGDVSATMAKGTAAGAFVGHANIAHQSSERNCYWMDATASRANGPTVTAMPQAAVVAPDEIRTIVPHLGSAFAYSAYPNGAPVLTWTSNTAELRYLSANGSTVLAQVGIQAGATVSGADIAKMYLGETPTKTVDGRTARFLGWSTSANGNAGVGISNAYGVVYVYPVFEEPTQPVKPAGEWVASGGRWWFRHTNGTYTRSAWEYINNAWYHFDADGWMQTGWLKLGSTWYYLKPSGAMAEGWQLVSGVWYYLTPSDGAMRTGWLHLGNTWYYLRSNGAMATGWQKVGVKWYYLNTNGAMAEGWKRVGGTWYYLLPTDGAMKTGWLLLDGAWYYLRSSGAMVTGWLKIGGTWYYFNGSGVLTEELIEG